MDAQIGDAWTVYIGANNRLDCTQAGEEDAPRHWVSTDPADRFNVR